jgi:hypothetical protein
MITSRRSLITGLGALFIAAPAIVRASSLMPVKAFVDTDDQMLALLKARMDEAYAVMRENLARSLYGDFNETASGDFSLKEWVTPLDITQRIA